MKESVLGTYNISGFFLKSCVREICVKQIWLKQGVGVYNFLFKLQMHSTHSTYRQNLGLCIEGLHLSVSRSFLPIYKSAQEAGLKT